MERGHPSGSSKSDRAFIECPPNATGIICGISYVSNFFIYGSDNFGSLENGQV